MPDWVNFSHRVMIHAPSIVCPAWRLFWIDRLISRESSYPFESSTDSVTTWLTTISTSGSIVIWPTQSCRRRALMILWSQSLLRCWRAATMDCIVLDQYCRGKELIGEGRRLRLLHFLIDNWSRFKFVIVLLFIYFHCQWPRWWREGWRLRSISKGLLRSPSALSEGFIWFQGPA